VEAGYNVRCLNSEASAEPTAFKAYDLNLKRANWFFPKRDQGWYGDKQDKRKVYLVFQMAYISSE
jgi:hypothetical protein